MRYHLTMVKNQIIKKATNNKCWRGCGEKVTLLHCWWECKLVQPLWKTIWSFLKKIEIELPYDPAIPLLGIYPEKMKTLIQKDTCRELPGSPVVKKALSLLWAWLQSLAGELRSHKLRGASGGRGAKRINAL